MRRLSWQAVLLALVAIPFAQAAVMDTLRNVGNRIIQLGNLSAFGFSDQTVVLSLMRIMIWILTFTIFFAVTSNEHIVRIFNRRLAMVVSLVIATIVAIFFVDDFLLLIGSGAATLVAFLLIAGPVVAVGYLLWRIPGQGQEEHAGHIFLKLCLCLFLLWMLGAIKYHLQLIGA